MYVFQFFCAPGTPVEPTRPPGAVGATWKNFYPRHALSSFTTLSQQRGRRAEGDITPPRGPPATSPTQRSKPRRKARSPPRHSDQGEPRTSAGPPATEPAAGGQPVSQEASSNTTQRVDEKFLHHLMTAVQIARCHHGRHRAYGPPPKGLSTLSQFLLYRTLNCS